MSSERGRIDGEVSTAGVGRHLNAFGGVESSALGEVDDEGGSERVGGAAASHGHHTDVCGQLNVLECQLLAEKAAVKDRDAALALRSPIVPASVPWAAFEPSAFLPPLPPYAVTS